MTFSAALTDFRAQFAGVEPAPPPGVDVIEWNRDTNPSDWQVMVARVGIDKLKRENAMRRAGVRRPDLEGAK